MGICAGNTEETNKFVEELGRWNISVVISFNCICGIITLLASYVIFFRRST